MRDEHYMGESRTTKPLKVWKLVWSLIFTGIRNGRIYVAYGNILIWQIDKTVPCTYFSIQCLRIYLVNKYNIQCIRIYIVHAYNRQYIGMYTVHAHNI